MRAAIAAERPVDPANTLSTPGEDAMMIDPHKLSQRVRNLHSLLVALTFLVSLPCAAETKITLKKSFIAKYKDLATITAPVTIDHVKDRPNPISKGGKEGDLHCSGRSDPIGLALVSEMMNARLDTDAQRILRDAEPQNDQVTITGAWRLWMEHGGGSDQVQGAEVSPAEDTNPDHVFEIHPITKENDHSVSNTLIPIEGYTAYTADEAFPKYESVSCKITQTGKTVTLTTGMAGYNYVDFTLRATKDPEEVEDGYLVLANVFKTTDSEPVDDDLVVRNRRMVFIKGTPPGDRAATLKKGDFLRVLGIPRIDLALVNWRASHAQSRPEVLAWHLPYEIIVVGVYGEQP